MPRKYTYRYTHFRPEEKEVTAEDKWQIPLSQDIVKNVLFNYLERKEIKTLSRLPSFKKSCEASLFLHYVAWGEQRKAELLLKNKPDLVLQRGEVVDFSGRVFSNITALQYTVWALDRHMWKVIMQSFKDPDKALGQITELEKNGVKYFQPKTSTRTKYEEVIEQHYDFSKAGRALEKLIKNYDDLNKERVKFAWVTAVGFEQRYFPAHLASEWIDFGYQIQNFEKKQLVRQLHVLKPQNSALGGAGRFIYWFDAVSLGIDYAIFPKLGFGKSARIFLTVPFKNQLSAMLNNYNNLVNIRSHELDLLKENLSKAVNTISP